MSRRLDSVPEDARRFATTRWSVVLSAGRGSRTGGADALEQLCRTYWYPLYAFVRRQGYSSHDAQDLIQGYFERLLEKHYLEDVNREKGRFRSFLLASLKHFIGHQREKARALKRGGGCTVVSLDHDTAEVRYREEPADTLSADRIFERRWALTVLEVVMAQLRASYAASGKGRLFHELKETLTGSRRTIPYAELAERLGLSEGALKVSVHRLRQKYRQTLRREIANTVSDPAEVDEELRYLFSVLGG